MAASKKKAGVKKEKMVKSSQKSTQAMSQGERKKGKFHPGTVALREIKKYQKTTDMLIPRAPF